MESEIRDILRASGNIDGIDRLGPSDDLFENGMSSFHAVQVMMAIEDRYDIQFTDDLMKKTTFSTLASLLEAVRRLSAA